LLQKNAHDISAPENQPSLADIAGTIPEMESFAGERMWITADGRRMICEINAHRFELDGKPTAIVIAHDITERKRIEQALRESEAKFRNLAEQSPNMIFINKQGHVVYANSKCEEILGYERHVLCDPGFDYLTLIAPEYHDKIMENFKNHARGKDVGPYEYIVVAKDGRRVEAIITTKLIDYEGGKAILGIVTDITQSRRLERELAEADMRQRIQIGHDIHDGLGQLLTGLSLQCMALEQKIAVGTPLKKKDVAEIGRLVSMSIQQAHDISEGLSPSQLKQGDIVLAFQALAAQSRKLLGVRCVFKHAGDIKKVNDICATHLYRIAQEAITNGARHGGAQRIDLSLIESNGSLTMTVADNGCGIGDESLHDDTHMGMRIMRYRARMIGAMLDIGKRQKEGTYVTCRMHDSCRRT